MNKPTSLYIHIPFCEYICDYCDFTKLQYFRNFALLYIKSLKKEIESLHIDNQLETIYIGGGTPSSLETDLLEELLSFLDKYSNGVKEYTFEANPESLNEDKIKLLKKHHINRVSLGVESTNDKILKAINRHHTFEDVKTAVTTLRKHNINNINLDLILGLPNVTNKMLIKDIDNIVSLSPNHISAYSLTVHPNTMFYIKNIATKNSEEERELYDLISKKLLGHGYIHYEVSNFAKDEFYSLHNLTYWQNKEYYAAGLGASGYIGNVRYTNTRNINKYNKDIYERENEIVDLDEEYVYQVMLNLRTIFGLDLNMVKEKYHKDLFKEKDKEINNNIDNGLLILKDNHLIPTYEGMMVLDKIILELI